MTVLASVIAIAPAAHADTPRAGGDFYNVPGGAILFNADVGANVSTPIQALGVAGIPKSNVAAVLVDVTAESTTATTFLDVYESGTSRTTSNLNAPAKTPGVSNTVTVPVGSDGKIAVYNAAGTTRVTMDVQGYYTASDTGSGHGGLVPVTQTRIVDTRSGIGTAKKVLAANASLTVTVAGGAGNPVPAGAFAAYLDVIVTGATIDGYLSASPTAGPANGHSLVNFPAGSSDSGVSVVPDSTGKVTFTNHSTGTLDLVLTAQAYSAASYTDGAGYRPVRQRLVAGVTVPANGTIDVPIAGRPGVATNGVVAAALELAVAPSTASGYLRIWPKGAAEPPVSSNNYYTDTKASSAWIQTGVDGMVTVRNVGTAAARVFVDLNGVFTTTHPTAAPPVFSPTAVQEVAPSGTTAKGLQYAYVDNTGRLLVGTQASEDDFSTVQYSTVSSLSDTFAGAADIAVSSGNAQVSAEYSDTGVRVKSAPAGTAPSSSSSTPFTNLGGSFAGSPEVATRADGSLVVFAVDTDGQLWFRPQYGTEIYWHNLGAANLVGTPTATPINNGLRLTAATAAGTLATATWINGVLSAWTDLGGSGITARPAVATRPGYLAQIVATQGDGTVFTRAQRADGTFAPAQVVGGVGDSFQAVGAPAVIFDGVSGQLELLARSASDGHIYSSGETAQGSQTWRTWTSASGDVAATDPTMAAVTGSSNGYGWIGVYRTPQNASRVITPRYDAGAGAQQATLSGTSEQNLAQN